MLGLVLETSTERDIFAVFDGMECIFNEQLPFGLQSSHLLLPGLQKKLEEKGFKLSNLAYIVVGIGPGSYTGIRIGVTIAKTLAFVLKVPLIGICTLDAFIPEKAGVFAAVIDAKIGGVYLKTGRLEKDRVETFVQAQAFSLDEAAKVLASIPTIVTPNAEKIRPKLEAIRGGKWHWEERYPQAEELVREAQRKLQATNHLDGQHLELLYLRKTQAEIEREARKSDLS